MRGTTRRRPPRRHRTTGGSGSRPSTASATPGCSRFSRHIAVSTTPGATVLNRMPRGPNSIANDRVIPSRAALLAAYTARRGAPRKPEIELIDTTEAWSLSRRCGMAAAVTNSAERTLTCHTRSTSSAVSSSEGFRNAMPALLTSTSSPTAEPIRRRRRRQAAGPSAVPRSAVTTTGSLVNPAAVSFNSSSERATSATRAPAAVERPGDGRPDPSPGPGDDRGPPAQQHRPVNRLR